MMHTKEIKKHTSQSNPVKNMNIKLSPTEAKKTCTPGIYIRAMKTKNKTPIRTNINLFRSSIRLFINDLFGLLI